MIESSQQIPIHQGDAPAHQGGAVTGSRSVPMDAYLRDFERTLRLDPEETRAIVAEVRGNLDDLIAHLRGQGYADDEAECEALRRFDDAKGLANALRRAHRRAPPALQLLAALLVVTGIGGVLLSIEVLQAAATVGLHPGATTLSVTVTPAATRIFYSQPWRNYRLIEMISLVLLSVPGLVILGGAIASLWMARAVVLGQRRPRWRRVGAGMSVAALCDVAVVLFLLSTLQAPAAGPQPIPGGKQLAAAGLCFRPAPRQPTSPVMVDRLCADRTATYVQYHIPDPTRGEPAPYLYDGRAYSPQRYADPTYPLVSCAPCAGYSTGPSTSQGLRAFMPWRGGETGLAQFTALDSRTHEVVLVMGQYVMAPGSEVVRIPVSLRAWDRVGGGTHPFITTSARGVRVNLMRVIRGVTGTILDYTIDAAPALVPRGAIMTHPQSALLDTRGHMYEQVAQPNGEGCRQVGRGGGHCAPEAFFAPLPRGARLTLIVQSFAVYPAIGARGHSVIGPWRVPFVMP